MHISEVLSDAEEWGLSAPFALDGRFVLLSAVDVGEDCAEVVEGFAQNLVAGKGD